MEIYLIGSMFNCENEIIGFSRTQFENVKKLKEFLKEQNIIINENNYKEIKDCVDCEKRYCLRYTYYELEEDYEKRD